MDTRRQPTPPIPHTAVRTRRVWITPSVRRLKAGDAENGITNNVVDGFATFRS